MACNLKSGLALPRQLRQSRNLRPFTREIHCFEPAEICCSDCGSDMDHLSEVSAEHLKPD